MIQGTLVAEVRATRDEISHAYEYDVDAIFDALRRIDVVSGREHVSLEPRQVQAGCGLCGLKDGEGSRGGWFLTQIFFTI